jgi:hypothetical protein
MQFVMDSLQSEQLLVEFKKLIYPHLEHPPLTPKHSLTVWELLIAAFASVVG